MKVHNKYHRSILQGIARQAMLERGLLTDFSGEALAELERLSIPVRTDYGPDEDPSGIRDMRDLLWSSLDNDDSRDLDQLTVAGALPEGKVRIMVAIADVDSLVKDGSAIDEHARHNTTSVYTAAMVFPMLPEKLSTDLTSLNSNKERLALVVEMEVAANGALLDFEIYRACVRNQAKLTYKSVGAWLEGNGMMPESVSSVPGMDENLHIQDRVAQSLRKLRHLHGALSLETVEGKTLFEGDQISAIAIQEMNRARQIIEDFMIATNSATARFLSAMKFPSIRRVVRTPKRWERIVQIADEYEFKLPELPNSKALDEFLVRQKAADPLRFPDLSLAVIKLLGAGEYVAQLPGEVTQGHFGLAVRDYAHSTAPNRRYPDLLTQRLLKAALESKSAPYSNEELDELAAHCTEAEDAANKVERQVAKSAAALLIESRKGEWFDSIVTGASEKGSWVRLLNIPVEGKLVDGFEGLDVGERIRVQLIDTDVERGFIDFRSPHTR